MDILILNQRGFHISTAKTSDSINSFELHVSEVNPTTHMVLEIGCQYQIGYINGNNMVHRVLTTVDPNKASAIFSVRS